MKWQVSYNINQTQHIEVEAPNATEANKLARQKLSLHTDQAAWEAYDCRKIDYPTFSDGSPVPDDSEIL